ncbi:hypothetical protein [Streptomyces sp. MS2.AVA.5]|uniref:Uncharacterized protein n=1 Tax=Streptomyces achmelvichensis TaxID=3134111 RepID=A0ACC6PKU5_9ACTN
MVEHVLSCQRCHKTSVVHQHFRPELPQDNDLKAYGNALKNSQGKARLVLLVYPRRSSSLLHEAAPDEVRALFGEATSCQEAGALRAAAAMYRATVEEICRDRQAAGKV